LGTATVIYGIRLKEAIKMKTTLKWIGVSMVVILTVMLYFDTGFCGGFIYVPNFFGNNVSVIDPATNSVLTTITVGKYPVGIAVNPNGTLAYVTNMGDDNVSVIDTATNTVVKTYRVGSEPVGVAVTPDGGFVYVANFGTGTVSVINAVTGEVIKTIAVGDDPRDIMVNRSGTRVYVYNEFDRSVSVIDTATNTVVSTISGLSAVIGGVYLNPEGTKIYLLDETGKIMVIDALTHKVVDTITVPIGQVFGNGLSVSPDQKLLYVIYDNSVVQYNLVTKTSSSPIPIGVSASSVSISSDGKRLYVTSGPAKQVVVIDTDSGSVISSVQVGDSLQPVGNITNIWTNWTGPVSFTLKTTIPVEDSFGNTNFQTSNNPFSGSFQLNTIGRFPGPASIFGSDGSILANFDKVATIQTNNDKKKTDKMMLTGVGTNPLYPLASAFKFNATGTWNKDSSGNPTSLKISGDLGIGYDFGGEESSKFSTTLTPEVM
jgi:YVTN family beta-propeller protein